MSGARPRRWPLALAGLVLLAGLGVGAAVLGERRRARHAPRDPGPPVPMGTPAGAGYLGGRYGARRNLVARGGGSIATESAVEAALKWLARHQSPDGRWEAEGFDRVCKGACGGHGSDERDVGISGLALLSFLAAGYDPTRDETYEDAVTHQTVGYGAVVRRGLLSLAEAQGSSGDWELEGPYSVADQSLATAALCEAYAVTDSPLYGPGAHRGVEALLRARNAGAGWGQRPRSGASDSLDTGFALLALESAALAGIETPPAVFAETRAWLEGVAALDSRARSAGEHPLATAVLLLGKVFPRKQATQGGGEWPGPLVTSSSPEWARLDADRLEWKGEPRANDLVYGLLATLAVFQTDRLHAPRTGPWKKWNKAMADSLCMNQAVRKNGCRDGSWDPELADPWTRSGGRVAATALGALMLETYYRYPR